jgi:hypothetical protein
MTVDAYLRQEAENYAEENNLSWLALANKAGIERQIMYRFRTGAGMNGENTIRLADAIDLSITNIKYNTYEPK